MLEGGVLPFFYWRPEDKAFKYWPCTDIFNKAICMDAYMGRLSWQCLFAKDKYVCMRKRLCQCMCEWMQLVCVCAGHNMYICIKILRFVFYGNVNKTVNDYARCIVWGVDLNVESAVGRVNSVWLPTALAID